MNLNEYMRFALKERGHTKQNINTIMQLAESNLYIFLEILELLNREIQKAEARRKQLYSCLTNECTIKDIEICWNKKLYLTCKAPIHKPK